MSKTSLEQAPSSFRDWQKTRRAWELAGQGFELDTELPASLFERLAPSAEASEPVAGIEGGVRARVAALASGARGSEHLPHTGRPGFIVEANARIRLNCQSCGTEFLELVESASTLWVARDAAELTRWEQVSRGAAAQDTRVALEALLADEQVSALQLVEDELLLNLPLVPRCSECASSDSPRRIELF